MGLSSSPVFHLCAFSSPKYRLKEYHLTLYHRKWPSCRLQFLFDKYLLNGILLVEDFIDLQLLFPKHSCQECQFSKCRLQLMILCFLHKLWYKAWGMPSRVHIELQEKFLCNFWLPNRLYLSVWENRADISCHLQVLLRLMLLQTQKKSDQQWVIHVQLDSLEVYHDFPAFSTCEWYNRIEKYPQ